MVNGCVLLMVLFVVIAMCDARVDGAVSTGWTSYVGPTSSSLMNRYCSICWLVQHDASFVF